jgi:hypothetical protein
MLEWVWHRADISVESEFSWHGKGGPWHLAYRKSLGLSEAWTRLAVHHTCCVRALRMTCACMHNAWTYDSGIGVEQRTLISCIVRSVSAHSSFRVSSLGCWLSAGWDFLSEAC